VSGTGASGAISASDAVRCTHAPGAQVRCAGAQLRPAGAGVLALMWALAMPSGLAQTPVVERLGEVRVHGNHTTPDEVVLSLAALTVGADVTQATLQQAEERLRKSDRFAGVEIRKRYRSLDDPTDVLAIIVVDERAAVSSLDLTPGPFKRITSAGMWLPIVSHADGYGFTYGARVSFVNALGPRSRLSVPLTWGGERKAAMEVERTFDRGPFTRIGGFLGITRRVNPFYELEDTRREIGARAERALTPWLRLGGGARVSDVHAAIQQRHVSTGADVVLDTRIDPAFPRNAVHVVTGIEQLHFTSSQPVRRWTSDARGYIGLMGSSVLALRALTSQVNQALPAYERALIGGSETLRGYDFGYRTGDNLVALSAEVRVPLTSPVHVGRFGVKGFVDAGTVYGAGYKLADQPFDRGIGGGVFFTATVIRAGVDVAWPLRSINPSADPFGRRDVPSDRPRWHLRVGVTF
jgi:outer membrane protein assembly factor BamA